jgi:hypothetical protein
MICAKTGPAVLVQDLGAGDVGRHQIGRELNPLEAEIQDAGERLDEQRLGKAGHARDQAVAAGEERDEDLIHHLVLSDDHLPQLVQYPLAALCDLLGRSRRQLGRRLVR